MITQRNRDDLKHALSLMKTRRSGGTWASKRHCELIIRHRQSQEAIAKSPTNSSAMSDYTDSLNTIGKDVEWLTSWVPSTITVKTLINQAHIDPLRYIPSWVKKMSKRQVDQINSDLTTHSKHQEIKHKRTGRKPSTLRGILKQRRMQES